MDKMFQIRYVQGPSVRHQLVIASSPQHALKMFQDYMKDRYYDKSSPEVQEGVAEKGIVMRWEACQ